MPRTATATAYTYLDCTECGRGISTPFSRVSGPVAYVHQGSNTRCRLIVWPDPEGDAHRTLPVPHEVSLEEALESALRFASRRGWTVSNRFGAATLATAA